MRAPQGGRLAHAVLGSSNMAPRLSPDQCRAIADHLLGSAETAERGRWFAEMAETAEREDWPSSCSAPFQLLSREESAAIWVASFAMRQRVFAPLLTKTERDSLSHEMKEAGALAQKAFSRKA
jgi:hypothetical protein